MENIRIYTRSGDKGTTGLASGARVKKNHQLPTVCGNLDELMGSLGIVHASLTELCDRKEIKEEPIYKYQLAILQKIVFDCGTDITTSVFNEKKFTKKGKEIPQNGTHLKVNDKYITYIENLIDKLSEDLELLHSFIMPLGETTVVQLHSARSVCRRAERSTLDLDELNPEVAQILNRLSDLLFVMARHVNCVLLNEDEAIYDPRKSALN